MTTIIVIAGIIAFVILMILFELDTGFWGVSRR